MGSLRSLLLRPPLRLRVAAVVGALAVTAAACGSTSAASHTTTAGSRADPGSGGGAVTLRATTNSTLGQTILVGAGGRTLYLFEKDTKGKFSCSGSCTSVWPPLLTSGKPHAGSGINASLLGTIARPGGKTQVTYAGHPLYYYAADSSAGQANGEGLLQFGAKWYVVSPHGIALTSSKSSGGASGYGSSSSSSSSSSSGGGWSG